MSGKKMGSKPMVRSHLLSKLAKRHKESALGKRGLHETDRNYAIPVCDACGIPSNWMFKGKFFCAICNIFLMRWRGVPL